MPVHADPSAIKEILQNYTVDPAWQRELYEHLHAHPELSMQEKNTHARILKELERFNCRVIAPIGGYGIVAVFHNGEAVSGSAGPTVLFRADFDGLPVTETTGAPYASKDTATRDDGTVTGLMHACGHDMHVTALLGLCDIMDNNREHWAGTFIALFQPAEEIGQGATAMITDGLTDRIPRPDICLGQHVMPGRAGQVQTKPGPQFAACDSIRIRIPGRGAHGSMPHAAVDPTYTAAHIILRLQGIVGREVNPSDFAVVSVGQVKAGTTNNIIPDHAELVLNCRFYNDAVKNKVYEAIQRVVIAECDASGIKEEPHFEYFAHGELLDNDRGAFMTVRSTFDEVFGPDSVDAEPSTVSEDFANIPLAFGVPYIFWLIGSTPRTVWDKAVAENRVITDVPVNHMPTFLPEYEPTVNAATNAAAAAVLTYLAIPEHTPATRPLAR